MVRLEFLVPSRKISTIILTIILVMVCIYVYQFSRTSSIQSLELRLDTTKLKFTSKVQPFWYNDICLKEKYLINFNQEQRVNYYISILYMFSDELSKSGEGGMIYYECLTNEDKIMLISKIREKNEKSNFVLSKNGQNYISFIESLLLKDNNSME